MAEGPTGGTSIDGVWVVEPLIDQPVFDELDLETPWSADRRFKPRLMARWLSPPQLMDAGLKELVAGLFETFADRRDSLEARENVVLLHPSVEIAPEATLGSTSTPLTSRPLLPVGGDHPSDEGFWIDYVADLGDGFSTTYSVAAEIAMRGSDPKGKTYRTPDGGEVSLQRGELLIMGGDEVYPLASDEEYRNRTIGPYETACRQVEPGMSVLAVPGNHDWYDGLTAFLSRFCTEQWIGGWQTRQSRSYWAAKVQPGWWVWGIDVALEHVPIDHHQLQYFRSVAAELEPGDQIILATAMPSWLSSDRPRWIQKVESFARGVIGSAPDEASPDDDPYDQLAYFMSTALASAPESDEHIENPPRFALALSGDKHYYCRHDNEAAEPNKRFTHIVAGGGGAYMSLPVRLANRVSLPWPRKRAEGDAGLTLDKEAQWPDPGDTRVLAVSALWRMITRNWGLCAVMSAFYLLLVTTIQSGDRTDFTASWFGNIEHSISSLTTSPWLAMVGVVMVLVVSLTSKLPAALRFPLALLQTGFHLAALSGAAAVARWAMSGDLRFAPTTWASIALIAAALAWAGWGGWTWWVYRKFPVAVTGGCLAFVGLAIAMAIVQWEAGVWAILVLGLSLGLSGVAFSAGLIVAVTIFGDQMNELSVAIREDGFKNFIRLNIDADGDLHAYVIGLEKIPYQRLRFRSNEPGTLHRGTPEVTTLQTQSWIPGVSERYEAKVVDQFTIRGG